MVADWTRLWGASLSASSVEALNR